MAMAGSSNNMKALEPEWDSPDRRRTALQRGRDVVEGGVEEVLVLEAGPGGEVGEEVGLRGGERLLREAVVGKVLVFGLFEFVLGLVGEAGVPFGVLAVEVLVDDGEFHGAAAEDAEEVVLLRRGGDGGGRGVLAAVGGVEELLEEALEVLLVEDLQVVQVPSELVDEEGARRRGRVVVHVAEVGGEVLLDVGVGPVLGADVEVKAGGDVTKMDLTPRCKAATTPALSPLLPPSPMS
mmetsp:Transcript_12215/g.36838  ORF Transcript_12215/g.36838 Transcript_12215/m.36838 type:complete len:237 (+) Transcript_12215:405-1115(+)